VVDSVEEAVGDSEEAAGKSGGSGVAAAVGAVEAAVDKVVIPTAKSGAATKGGGHVAAVAAAAEAKSSIRLPGVVNKAGAAGDAKVVTGEHSAGKAGVGAAAAAAVGAENGANVRKLEDSALNDAAQAQEQVRQGESELKHLKTLLAKAHKLKQDGASSASSSSSSSRDDSGSADADAGLGFDDADTDGLAAPKAQTLAFKSNILPRVMAAHKK
jgi:hypothetical protein